MLKMVDGTGIIGVDMICPLGVSAPQPPNYDRVELEGAGMLVLPNSLKAPLERVELGGKTEQVTTTGKNLFDTKTYRDMNGCEIINNNQISFIQNLAKITYEIKLDSGDYRISFKRKKYSSFTIRNGESVLHTNGGENDYGYTIKLSEPAVISIEFASCQNPNAEQRIIYNIQLEKSSTATPYEPYTGGKPAPSPEYPQEIKSVGKWNDEKQKYEVEISISGRNLFDFSTCEEGKIFEGSGNIVSTTNGVLTDFIPCFPNSQYSRSRTGSTVVAFYDCNKNKIGFEIVGNTTFVTPEKCRYFRFSAVKTQVDYTKIVACPGNTVMDYEPYKKPQSLTLTSDRPITKWDRLVEQGGQIGWLYGSVIATIDETASISLYTPNGFYVYVKNIDKKEKTGYCDKLYAKRMSNGEPFVLFGNANNNVLYTLNTQEFYGKTASEIKAKLKEYPLNIIGKSETTEFVPLPQEEQNAIRALTTHYPTTVITADGGELDPDIKVTYRKEI